MNPADRLRPLRAETAERIAVLAHEHAALVAASRAANLDDEHDPEGATVAFERAQLDAVAATAAARLAQIDQALLRVEDGSYGRCAGCGGPIGAERLAARPVAERCRDCA